MQVITEKQDLTWLRWTTVRNSISIAGSFLKAMPVVGSRTYYKLSNFNVVEGIVGHECVNEVIADRLLTLLGIDHLSYTLIHADIMLNGKVHDTWLCSFDDFKKPGQSKIALDVYYEIEHMEGESPLEFCVRQGWSDDLSKMLAADYLMLNRDRHGANIEVLRDPATRSMTLTPLFDHGLSFVFNSYTENSLEKFDVLSDKRVQCFIGGCSTWDNLQLLPAAKLNKLRETDREFIFADLELALRKPWRDKIWDMIWRRWCQYEDLCNKRER